MGEREKNIDYRLRAVVTYGRFVGVLCRHNENDKKTGRGEARVSQ